MKKENVEKKKTNKKNEKDERKTVTKIKDERNETKLIRRRKKEKVANERADMLKSKRLRIESIIRQG